MTSPNRDAAVSHYQALADAAAAPVLRQLLRDCRLRISDMDPLSRRIDDALGEKPIRPVGGLESCTNPLHRGCGPLLREVEPEPRLMSDAAWSYRKLVDL